MRIWKCKRWSSVFGNILGGIAVVAMAGAAAGFALPADHAQITTESRATLAFNRIEDLFKKLQELAKKAKEKSSEAMSEADKAIVLGYLDGIQAEIDTLLDPSTDPSLQPGVVGDLLDGFNPQSLQDHAQDTLWLATAAYDEILSPTPNHFLISSYVLTIEHWLDGYRQAVIDA